MLKKILIAIASIFVISGVYLIWRIQDAKTLITPYPYFFTEEASKSISSELQSAENSKVLIIGDRMAKALDPYIPTINQELAKTFKTSPKIYNWSTPNEGIHRAIFKLKSLKKLPPVIIYHGSSTELFEKTFAIEDKSSLFKNFDRFDNEKIISLIITFPWLSRILYSKMNYIDLGKTKENVNRLNSYQRIDEAEISFKLYQYQLSELIEYVKEQKSSLIIITTPLNLETRPKEICSHSTSNQVVEVQQEIENLIKEGNFKESYTKSLELADATPGNALSFYLLGQSALRLGKTVEAKQALFKSTVFDCSHWRGNAVYNAIMRTLGGKNLNTIIDFDQYMAASINKDGLFMDDIYPQTIFYQTIIHDLVDSIRLLLSTKS